VDKRKRAGLDHHGVVAGELKRRVSLLAKYLGMPWPKDEDAWLRLVIAICSHWQLPGFQLVPTGSGAKKKWPLWRNIELLFDVHSLTAKNKRLSEYGACQYIAQHPEKYDNRYPRGAASVHRQFLRAKTEFSRSESQSTDPKSIAEIDQYLDFLATRRRILDKFAAQESEARIPRRKVRE
jgi:hypothetical protein